KNCARADGGRVRFQVIVVIDGVYKQLIRRSNGGMEIIAERLPLSERKARISRVGAEMVYYYVVVAHKTAHGAAVDVDRAAKSAWIIKYVVFDYVARRAWNARRSRNVDAPTRSRRLNNRIVVNLVSARPFCSVYGIERYAARVVVVEQI